MPSEAATKRPLAIADVLNLHSFHATHGNCFAFSPDGKLLSFCVQRPLNQARGRADAYMAGIARGELHTIDLSNLESSRPDTTADCFAPRWSPCGRYLAFGQAASGSVFLSVMRRGECEPVPLGGQLQLRGVRPFEWIGNGLLIGAFVPPGGRPWLAGLDDRATQKSAEFRDLHAQPHRRTSSIWLSPSGSPDEDWPHEFEIYDVESGTRQPLSMHECNPEVLAFRRRYAAQVDKEDSLPAWEEIPQEGERVAAHQPSGQVLFLVEDDQGSRLVLRSRDAPHRPREIFRINTHLAHVQAGEIRDLVLTGADSSPRTARVILPPEHRPGKTWPAVFWVYPGAMPGPRPRHQLKPHEAGIFNLQLLAALGYAVIDTPLPIPSGEPLDLSACLAQTMQAVVDECVRTGLIDKDRLHVYGHSLGGWAAMSLLGTTSLFKSGIAMAGVSNLISFHGSCDPRMRYDESCEQAFAFAEMCERIFCLGIPPWADPDRYVRNSPVFFADRISSPLLIIQGDQDYVPIAQGEEMFSALKQLGKACRFIRFWGEGHILSKTAHIEEAWQEIARWLEVHG